MLQLSHQLCKACPHDLYLKKQGISKYAKNLSLRVQFPAKPCSHLETKRELSDLHFGCTHGQHLLMTHTENAAFFICVRRIRSNLPNRYHAHEPSHLPSRGSSCVARVASAPRMPAPRPFAAWRREIRWPPSRLLPWDAL